MLLQGPTSAGKTSLVAYLAAQTGHHLVRINNHEHTDLQVRCGELQLENLGTCTDLGKGRGLHGVGALASLLPSPLLQCPVALLPHCPLSSLCPCPPFCLTVALQQS